MDTQHFLKAILPPDGFYYLARWVESNKNPKGGFFIHEAYTDIAEFSDALIQWGRKTNVYHACSSFTEVQYKQKQKPNGEFFDILVGRTKDNVRAAKSFWLDLDVKPGVAGAYASKAETRDDIKKVRDLLGATPIIVDSGNGIHLYFPTDEAMPRRDWERIANKLRTAIDHLGIKHDTSRTTDIASILRPVGSFNRKDKANPKGVKYIKTGDSLPVAVIEARLDQYLDQANLHVSEYDMLGEAPKGYSPLNTDLITNPQYPDSDAYKIADKCNQIRLFADTGGESEPVWWACVGVVKHCVNGEAIVHEWSAKYPSYDADETDTKMQSWGFGPTSCEKFRSINAAGCEGCTNECKSPIQLGHVVEENPTYVPMEVEVLDETGVEELEVGPGSEFWPEGYQIRNGNIWFIPPEGETDENGNPSRGRLVCHTVFWVLNEVRNEGSEYVIHMRSEVRSGKYEDFDVPMSALSSADKLRTALSAKRIHVASLTLQTGKDIVNLVMQQALAMQRRREEINTFNQLGWTKDRSAFLFGDRLVGRDGERKVRVSNTITSAMRFNGLLGEDGKSGTIDQYKRGVAELYGYKGFEAAQYILASALGAYLVPFCNDSKWHGIPLSVYSSRSGYGKTTLVAIGLNAMMYHGNSMFSEGTLLWFKKMLSVYGSQPIFFDEITDKLKDPTAQQDLLYNWSLGVPRGRLKETGEVREAGLGWDNMGFLTTNTSVLFKLAENPDGSEATQVRVLEIDLAQYLPRKPKLEHADTAKYLQDHVYGIVTEPMIRMIIANREKITEYLETEFHKVASALPQDEATTARYLCHHASCTLVGMALGRKLGLWDFSVNTAREWIVKHIKHQLRKVEEYRVAPEDRFSSMMADFTGRLVVTTRFDTADARSKNVEEPLVPMPTRSVAGRIALGCPSTPTRLGDPGRVYISISAFNEWCRVNKLNPNEVRREWIERGLIDTTRGSDYRGENRVKLDRGLATQTLPQTRCLEFSVSKIREFMPDVDVKLVQNAKMQAKAYAKLQAQLGEG